MTRIGWLLVLLSPLTLAATLEVQILDSVGKPVEDAVVYVDAPGNRLPAPGKAMVDQVKKEFAPYVSVVQTGTPISFPNKDDIRHHVYSFSPAKTFDIKLYSGTPSKPVIFDKPGLVVLGCNIHDWMLAYVLVVNTPWFDKSDARGHGRIDNLPGGDYRLHVWHPRMSTELEQGLKMTAQSQTLTVRVALPKPDPRSAGAKP